MNGFLFPRHREIDWRLREGKRMADNLPSVRVEQTPDGELHKFVYTPEDLTPPAWTEFRSEDMSLDAQIKAGVNLQEVHPIMPNTMDAIAQTMSVVAAQMSNPQNYNINVNND